MVLPHADMTFQGQDMNIQSGLRGFHYTESVYGCATYRIDALTNNWSLWDNVIQDMGQTAAKFRFGVDYDDTPTVSPWKEILLTNTSFPYSFPLLRVTASGVCAGFKMTESYYEKTYKDMKISDIVQQIASRNGLDVDVEETKGKYWLHQCTLPDGSFIKQVLLPLAVSNSSGRSDYYFWIQDGKKLIFKPPVLGSASQTFQISPQGMPPGTLIPRIRVHFRRIFMEDDECWKTTGRGYDRFKKQCITWDADDGSVKYSKLANHAPSPPKQASKVLVLNRPLSKDNRSDEVKEATEGAWSRNMHGLFRIELISQAMIPTVQPTDIIQLDIKDQDGNEHFLSGNYFLYSATHSYSAKGLKSILHLERRTYR